MYIYVYICRYKYSYTYRCMYAVNGHFDLVQHWQLSGQDLLYGGGIFMYVYIHIHINIYIYECLSIYLYGQRCLRVGVWV